MSIQPGASVPAGIYTGPGVLILTHAGAPVTADGTFVEGALALDLNDALWICTDAGTPGTWSQITAGTTGPVLSVFGRGGAVVAVSGDYTAGQVTNAADKSAAGQQTFTGNVQTPSFGVGTAPDGTAGDIQVAGSAAVIKNVTSGGNFNVTITGAGTLTVDAGATGILSLNRNGTAATSGAGEGSAIAVYKPPGSTFPLSVYNATTATALALRVDGSGNTTINGVASLAGGTDTSAVAAISPQAVTSGVAFTPSASTDILLYIDVTLGGTLTLTMGPSTGAENTIYNATAVVASPIGNVWVPKGWKVVITLVTATVVCVKQVV